MLERKCCHFPLWPSSHLPKGNHCQQFIQWFFPQNNYLCKSTVNTQGLISYITGYKQKAAEVSKVRSADSQHKAQLLQKYPVYLIIIDSSRRCDLAGLCKPRNLHFIKHLPWSSSEAEGSLLLKDLLKFNVVQILLPISPHIVLVKPLANCGYSNMALVCCHVQPLTSLAYFSLIPFFFSVPLPVPSILQYWLALLLHFIWPGYWLQIIQFSVSLPSTPQFMSNLNFPGIAMAIHILDFSSAQIHVMLELVYLFSISNCLLKNICLSLLWEHSFLSLLSPALPFWCSALC